MKKIFLSIFIMCFCFNSNFSFAGVISGKVDRYDTNYKNKVVNSKTQQPLANAKITIPELNYTTYSKNDGTFQLNADLTNKTVLFVEKDGYKVFSLTVDNSVLNSPLKLGIEETNPFDMQISAGILHLGDNMFSNNSANSSDFKVYAKGHYVSKTFTKPQTGAKEDVVVRIGTAIGLDTKKAKQMGQNRISKVYSSPPEIFVNGSRIGTLETNGDNHEFIIPKRLLKQKNELLIKTGQNLFQKEYVDYDDIELANIRIEVKQKSYYARH